MPEIYTNGCVISHICIAICWVVTNCQLWMRLPGSAVWSTYTPVCSKRLLTWWYGKSAVLRHSVYFNNTCMAIAICRLANWGTSAVTVVDRPTPGGAHCLEHPVHCHWPVTNFNDTVWVNDLARHSGGFRPKRWLILVINWSLLKIL